MALIKHLACITISITYSPADEVDLKVLLTLRTKSPLMKLNTNLDVFELLHALTDTTHEGILSLGKSGRVNSGNFRFLITPSPIYHKFACCLIGTGWRVGIKANLPHIPNLGRVIIGETFRGWPSKPLVVKAAKRERAK